MAMTQEQFVRRLPEDERAAYAAYREEMVETLGGFEGVAEAMRAFGYDADEDYAPADWVEPVPAEPVVEPVKKRRFGERRKKEELTEADRAKLARVKFDKSYALLPPNAAASVELDWISGHPALLRVTREDKGENYNLTAKEIKDAPSRRAVNQLQHWVLNAKNRTEFHKQLLTEQKKKGVDGDGEKADSELAIGEVEDLLRSLKRTTAAAEHG
jgi:hypothetical protein